MGLFGSRKSKETKKEPELQKDLAAPIKGVDPLENVPLGEEAAPTGLSDRRKLPSKEQRAYFESISNERASKPGGAIARILEESGLVSAEMVKEALKRSGEEATSLAKTLSQTGVMREEDFVDALAEGLGMEKVDLNTVNVTPELIQQIPPRVAKEYRIFPVRFDDNTIEIAIADPLNIQATDDLERILQKKVIGLVAREEDIIRCYKKYYEGDVFVQIYESVTEDLHQKELDANLDQYTEIDINEQSVEPVVKFVDLIFKQAVHDRASDIHIEPQRAGLVIRFRIDGVCHEVPSPPKKWQNNIISRLKVLSGMDLAEKRIPQDGRIKLNLADRKLDLRVNSLPTIYGESIVMRILDQSSVILGLEDVGFLPDNIAIFSELIRTPTGVILMTGPTGSGKTTTLYSALSTLNNPETKIITIENPVEYMLDGVIQVQVNEEVGLDFGKGLRSMLRQSPDVILVGEIRDKETSEIAVRAALTGHLVFSTLHTNDAPSAATRLIDMGTKPFLVASSVQAVIAQRLLRKICPHCKRLEHLDVHGIEGIGATELELENGIDAPMPVGCDRCAGSGYRGRTAIHEIFVMTPALRQLVTRGEPSSRLKKVGVRNGMRTLRMDGFRKVALGQTTLEELDRVTAADN
ncbi:MAG: type pilus assembly protein PilB [Candidatus Sumerlaeota bacterium]|nr:type pilus assembly protein PilB [Candidatus Sumerlaeota bacterium]